jgi:hypothetical protein
VDFDDRSDHDALPDVRDGLTRVERVFLSVMNEARAEFGERHIPVALIYGRVVEHINISVSELQRVLVRLSGR